MAAASSLLVLLLVTLCASISVCRCSGGQVRSQKLWGGRRGLLSLDDEIDELADLLPKKKDVSVAKEEPQLKKKKVSSEEVEEVKPKKKKTGLDESEEQLPKKKKNTVEELEEAVPKKKKATIEDLEEAVPKKKKATIEELEEAKPKKKKAVNEELIEEKQPKKKQNDFEKKKEIPIEEENQQQPKKKVKISIEEDDEQLKMKKKKISMEEQGEELPKKKKTTVESIDQTKVIKPIKDTKNQTKSPSNSLTPKSKNMNPITNQSKDSKSNSPPTKKTTPNTTPSKTQLSKSKNSLPSFDSESDEDLLSQFSDLPSNVHSDFDRISTTSKLYLNRANVEISQSFKPLVGSKYASMVASVSSYIFLLAPFIILSLLYSRIRAHFLPLQTILLFVQIYLSIYFSILSLSFLVTGLEPLKFFYATSAASYVYTQVLQTLAYVFYLLVLVMYLVVVFSSKEGGLGPRVVGLAQMMVGLGVGVHYYVAVSHRAVMREPPMTSWKSHAIYAALFMGVCLLARAERRKKAYLQEGDEGGKTN